MGDDFAVGQRLGDYEILGVLGAGGMGKVYKVRNVISDRVEAMKVLLANLAAQKDLADRFLREIKLLASLNHPNIAALRTALTLDNQLVMIMEYVEGTTLASRLQQGPIPAADAVNYTEQLLGALGYAHHLNVIHRDVKPGNMMLTPQGVVKLMDFGIARPNNEQGMTVTGATLGSLNYMSPEQVRGEAVDGRSDLYSMGVSLYEMVTGQLPFRGHSNYSVMSAHLQEVPQPPVAVRPNVPKGLNDIILIAMEKEPQARFQSADAFTNALKSVFPQTGATSTTPVRPSTPVPTVALPASVPGAAMAPPPQSTPASAAAGAAPMPPPSSGSSRGIYMALGGLLVVGILGAAAIYLPHRTKTQASSSSISTGAASDAPANVTPAVVPAAPENSPVAPVTPDSASANAAAVAAAGKAAAQSVVDSTAAAKKAQQQAAQQAADQAAAAAAAAEAQKKAAELADAEHESDQLTSRAAAVAQGLDSLRRGQAAQGLGLRGDMAAAEELMKTDLGRAQSAIDQKDGATAKDYLDKAEAQTEKLEKFLGR